MDWKDNAGFDFKTLKVWAISIDDAVYGEHTEFSEGANIKDIVAGYLLLYDFVGTTSPVDIFITVYYNGMEKGNTLNVAFSINCVESYPRGFL